MLNEDKVKELLAGDAERAWLTEASTSLILRSSRSSASEEGQTSVTIDALTSAGFAIPEELENLPSNASKSKIPPKPRPSGAKEDDQIAFYEGGEPVEILNSGVFDYYRSVFRPEDEALYVSAMGPAYKKTSKGKARDAAGRKLYYRTYWRTYQMSDHLPMWVEIGVG